ncbi:MAG: sigma-70 family RNA polymerase sigma factor [Candidatus Margulisiibacteriota bacterium]
MIDDQTIRQAQAGDLNAYEQIYQQHSGFVWKVICRMVKDKEECKDLMQEVFIRVYRKITLYRFEARFSTWLYRVAFSTVLNHLKKQQIQQAAMGLFRREYSDREEPDESGESDPELKKEVEQLLQQLNPNQRACVLLKDVEGFTYEEIAEMLNMRVGTVRSTLNRGRSMLRKKWRAKGSENHVLSNS